jgi:hypothetical protein
MDMGGNQDASNPANTDKPVKGNKMTTFANVSIKGYLVGGIWMPNCECYKPLDYDCTRQQRRTEGKMTLRDHVLCATNDGDFQSCQIADGYLEISSRKTTDNRMVTRTRHYDLSKFPSIADCVKTDWAGPSDDDGMADDR